MISGLYFITDSKLSHQGIVQDVRDVIEAGCKIVQYREKEKSKEEMLAEAKELAALCKEKSVLFMINNDVELALEVNADGVHLGQDDMPLAEAREKLGAGKIIGITVHNVQEALQAEKEGADYGSISPIFHTDTKKDAGKPCGIELIGRVKKAVKLPIVAIGGIEEENLEEVIAAGADSVAMISAIITSDDVEETVKRIVGRINDSIGKR